jgi:hypothetical protein
MTGLTFDTHRIQIAFLIMLAVILVIWLLIMNVL